MPKSSEAAPAIKSMSLRVEDISEETPVDQFEALAVKSWNREAPPREYESRFGEGNFTDTEFYHCAGVLAVSPEGRWGFRHISPIMGSEVGPTIKQFVDNLGDANSLRFIAFSGSDSLLRKVWSAIEGAGGKLEDGSVYIEEFKDYPARTDPLEYRKDCIFNAADRTLFVSSRNRGKIIALK